MTKRTVIILVVVLLAWVVLHDGLLFARHQRDLNDATYEMTKWAADQAAKMPRDRVALELVKKGQEANLQVYQYGQDNMSVEVWTQREVTDSWVAGTIINLIEGKPWEEAKGAPYTIRDHREAPVQ